MKKKILHIVLFACFALISLILLSGNVQAATKYNNEISYDENYDGTITVYAYSQAIINATIPSSINGKPVTNIGNFEGCSNLRTVTIPTSVKTIEYSAFQNCTALTQITIPNSVTKIEESAFEGCTSLKTVKIGTNVTEIESCAFKDCSSLTSINIPSKLKKIPEEFLEGCTRLSSITIPSNITTIGPRAFKNCTSFTNIIIPNTVTNVEDDIWADGTFTGCTALKTVTISSKVTTLPHSMFSGCTSLTSVTIPNSVTEVGNDMFSDCTSLKTVKLSTKLKFISDKMFYNCSNLTSVSNLDSVEYVSAGAFTNCKKITTLNFSDKLANIYDSIWSSEQTFLNCNALERVYFTASLKEIETDAFKGLSGVTFYGYAGTPAQEAARTLGFNYVECIPVSSIKITGATSVLKKSSITLKATVSPSNAFNKNVEWTSSNPSIATVDNNGIVKGLKSGKVTITARAKDGTERMATYTVNVKLTELPFYDVTVDHYFYNAVKYNYRNGYIHGTTSTTFSPNVNLTRGMLVTILYSIDGAKPVTTSKKFPDVTKGQYYYEAVRWATSKGIANGYKDGRFGPNDNITREQLSVMLYSYAKYKGKNVSATTSLSGFNDWGKVSGYAQPAVKWAIGKGIISGKDNGKRIDPQGKATRAEASVMIYSYCTKVK